MNKPFVAAAVPVPTLQSAVRPARSWARFLGGRASVLTRGTEAANEASEVPSTLSLLARRGDLQKTRAITELTDPLGDEV